MKLRPIQEDALNGAIQSFKDGGTYHLLQAPVAFGKTIFSSALMKHAVEHYGAKCLFLAHLKELVVQTVDKFKAVAPELDCGVVMGANKDISDVTVGTRQTVGKNLDLFGRINLGYLSPYRYKMAEALDEELSQVKKTAGEFNEGDLGEMMQEEHHLGTVKNAIANYGKGRKSILIFAVTIEHAEKLAEFLGCAAVHSKLEKNEWRSLVDSFKSGKVRMLVNVSQLSIGFDAPRVDCVVIARPTMSPALHTQICGRALRIDVQKESLYKKYLALRDQGVQSKEVISI